MTYLMNHCWCSDSIWGGQYDCRIIVSLESYDKREDVFKRIYAPDWISIIEEVPYDNGKEIPFKKFNTHRLKPEVVNWLNDNIKDVPKDPSDINYNENTTKAWAVGSDEYNSNASISFSLFFQRQTDAMKFIKTWSIHKNPVHYLNYFKDIRRELDPKTGRLKRVPRWTNTP